MISFNYNMIFIFKKKESNKHQAIYSYNYHYCHLLPVAPLTGFETHPAINPSLVSCLEWVNKSVVLNSFCYCNEIPIKIRELPTLHQYRKQVKVY